MLWFWEVGSIWVSDQRFVILGSWIHLGVWSKCCDFGKLDPFGCLIKVLWFWEVGCIWVSDQSVVTLGSWIHLSLWSKLLWLWFLEVRSIGGSNWLKKKINYDFLLRDLWYIFLIDSSSRLWFLGDLFLIFVFVCHVLGSSSFVVFVFKLSFYGSLGLPKGLGNLEILLSGGFGN